MISSSLKFPNFIPLFLLVFTISYHFSLSASAAANITLCRLGNVKFCQMMDICHQAPSLNDYKICEMMQSATIAGMMELEVNPSQNETHPPFPYDQQLLDRIVFLSEHVAFLGCLNLECACSHFPGYYWDKDKNKCLLIETGSGGQQSDELKKAHRKEIRMLTNGERQKFFDVLLKMKREGEYDAMAASHLDTNKMPGAHSGPGFLPWHREYMKRMELAMRRIDPNVALPYWDSTLDSHLEDPRDSIVWSELFFGTMSKNGIEILDGPFKDWITPEKNENLRRHLPEEQCENDQCSRPMLLDDIERIVDINMNGMLAFFVCDSIANFNTLEHLHDHVHGYVGGAMSHIPTAPGDPIFFLHHCFIDMLWEEWRQKHQTRDEREQHYPDEEKLKKCNAMNHSLDLPMHPFDYTTMKTGLANFYTDSFFDYAPRPSCGFGNRDCGSPYLFCHRPEGKIHVCVSKIRLGGRCARFQGNEENPCYFSDCIDGICMQKEEQKLLAIKKSHNQQFAEVPKNKTRLCYDGHECCPIWTHFGGCLKEPQRLNLLCPASCGYGGCVLPEEHKNNDCGNRLPYCVTWIYRDVWQCDKNRHWTRLNCAAECHKCDNKNWRLEQFEYCRDHFPKTIKAADIIKKWNGEIDG